ncbi:MAG: cell wall hydrolase [Sphingomicrobium sp.]|jgi:spore germination cell wall hydrolase CwlJ-like protein
MAWSTTLDGPLGGFPRSAVALWRAYPREVVGAGLLALVSIAAIATSIVQPGNQPGHEQISPPVPPSMVVRPLAPEQALKLNAEIPVASGPNPVAQPFEFKGNAAARTQALNCLASAVYYEAGNQDEDGERAVAQVVLNRVRHPAFPSTVCGVVYQGSTKLTGCQFTFTCDGSLNRRPDGEGWNRALSVAQAALAGSVYGPVGWATHYHANYVVPYWASTMAKNAVVGAHLFYRWAGSWGQPAVFTRIYAGHEPNAAALRSAALAAVHVAPAAPGTVAAAIKDIPGAEPLRLAPSMRGNKRVAVRFNLVARTASDQAPHEDYSKKFAASDNLKWSLSSDSVGETQQPLGRATSSSASSGAPR